MDNNYEKEGLTNTSFRISTYLPTSFFFISFQLADISRGIMEGMARIRREMANEAADICREMATEAANTEYARGNCRYPAGNGRN